MYGEGEPQPKAPEKRTISGAIVERLRDLYHLPKFEEVVTDIRKLFTLKSRLANYEEFQKFFQIEGIHEFLTEEYIAAFGDYLAKRIKELGATSNRPITILETGAGNGRLAYFINEYFANNRPEEADLFNYIAVDNKSWDRRRLFKTQQEMVPIEQMNYGEALRKYNPDVVITSWMPSNRDWSAVYRSTPSVKEYILIGYSFLTGKQEQTWSHEHYDKYIGGKEKRGDFEKVELDNVSKWQVSFIDEFLPLSWQWRNGHDQHSKTCSYRRVEKAHTEILEEN